MGFADDADLFAVESGEALRGQLESAARGAERVREALQRLLERVVLKLLHVTPSERAFAVVAAPLWPRLVKQCVADTLLRRWGAQSLAFVRADSVAMLALQRPTALLVDSGYAETRVVPVVLRTTLEHALRTTPAASARADAMLLDALRAAAPAASSAAPLDHALAEHTRLSHVHLAALDARSADVLVALGAQLSATLSRQVVNAAALDVLGADDDDRPLAALVVDPLLASPIDARAELARNVCAIGGGACAQGFAARRAAGASCPRRWPLLHTSHPVRALAQLRASRHGRD